MNILVLNCGSSSVKYKLIEIKANNILAEGGIEKIGLPGAFIKFKLADGSKKIIELDITDHDGAIKAILDLLTSEDNGCIKSFNEIDAVGHRVVHGGEKFNKSVLITDEVIAKVKECYDIAPLHNPVNIAGINAISKVLPDVPQVAVFDTAFHQTMPAKSYMYALPYKFYTEDGVRRYGFHGTSHKFVAEKAAEYVGMDWKECKIVTCHLGSGASIAAVENGKSVETSMGFTPVEGLIMGSRTGDLDLGAFIYIMDKTGYNTKEMNTLVNKKSGLIGITGNSQDMRDVYAGRNNGDERCTYAFNMFAHRVKKYIGAYAAIMNGMDLLVMTGGIGENAWFMREPILSDMEFLGIKIDKKVNEGIMGEAAVISTPDSKVKVVVFPTDEEYMIAKDTFDLVK